MQPDWELIARVQNVLVGLQKQKEQSFDYTATFLTTPGEAGVF